MDALRLQRARLEAELKREELLRLRMERERLLRLRQGKPKPEPLQPARAPVRLRSSPPATQANLLLFVAGVAISILLSR
jgi:hypothetical protein